MNDDMADTAASEPRSRSRLLLWIVVGIVAVVALFYGAIFFYTEVLNDSPDALDESDLGAALVDDTTIPTSSGTTDDSPATAETDPVATDPAATEGSATTDGTPTDGDPVADGFDGEWVATDASQFGYRVEEVLAGVNTTAVGRSNQITGTLTVDGTTVTAVDVEVDVASIESDEGRRDGQFRGRIMNTNEFPTATFVLTEPIELDAIPTGDETATATATGELTLRGVTNEVTFDVTAQTTGGRIGVLGSIPVVFADYEIDNPSVPGVQTEDHGLVEFVLVFARG